MTTIFNTIETASGKAYRIMNFLDGLQNNPRASSTQKVVYIAIGKPTPWTNTFGLNVSDINPPRPFKSTTEIPEPIVYVRALAGPAIRKRACDDLEPLDNIAATSSERLVEQSMSDLEYQYLELDNIFLEDGTFRILPEYVYIKGEIRSEDYTEDSWRASGLYTGLILEDGVLSNKELYLPSEIKGGILSQVTYSSPILREESKTHTFEYLVNL